MVKNRYAILSDRRVANLVVGPEGWDRPDAVAVDNRRVGLGWLYLNGEFVAPEPEPPAVPDRVEAHKLLAELSARGLRASVEALVAQSPEAVIDAFRRAPYMHRDSEMLNAAARALRISQDQLDAIFIAADARRT